MNPQPKTNQFLEDDDQPRGPTTAELMDLHLKRLIEARKGWSSWRIPLYKQSVRWQWWSNAMLIKRVLPDYIPWPKIDFAEHVQDSDPPMKMIKKCLEQFHDIKFEDFLDWILFNFGDYHTKELPPSVTPKHVEYWNQHFDLSMLLLREGDWIGQWYEVNEASNFVKGKQGFFTTPMNICTLMAKITMESNTDLLTEMNEPCCGTGRMFLAASNYTLLMCGQDINLTCIKICRINAWLYMPSIAMPCKDLVPSNVLKIPRKLWLQHGIDRPIYSDGQPQPIEESESVKSIPLIVKQQSVEPVEVKLELAPSPEPVIEKEEVTACPQMNLF